MLAKRKIKKGRNIYNFDESGVQIGCPKGEEVVVPIEVKELYSSNPENCMQLTVIESVAADGSPPIPPAIICPGKRFMESWFHDNFNVDELILLYKTAYSNKKVAIE